MDAGWYKPVPIRSYSPDRWAFRRGRILLTEESLQVDPFHGRIGLQMLEFREEATESPSSIRQSILDRDRLSSHDLAVHETLDCKDLESSGERARVEPILLAEPENLVKAERPVAKVGEDCQLPRRSEPPNPPRDLSDIRRRDGHRDTSLPDVRSCL